MLLWPMRCLLFIPKKKYEETTGWPIHFSFTPATSLAHPKAAVPSPSRSFFFSRVEASAWKNYATLRWEIICYSSNTQPKVTDFFLLRVIPSGNLPTMWLQGFQKPKERFWCSIRHTNIKTGTAPVQGWQKICQVSHMFDMDGPGALDSIQSEVSQRKINIVY